MSQWWGLCGYSVTWQLANLAEAAVGLIHCAVLRLLIDHNPERGNWPPGLSLALAVTIDVSLGQLLGQAAAPY